MIMMALVAMGDEVGKKMCSRTFDLIMEYCEPNLRLAIPLALALMYPSDPDMAVRCLCCMVMYRLAIH